MRELQAGDYVSYRLGDQRDPQDRRVWLTRWVHVEVLAIKRGRAKIRLVHFPNLRVRWVGVERLF